MRARLLILDAADVWRVALENLLDKLAAMVAALPSLVLGAVIVVGFWMLGRAIRALVRRSVRDRRRHRNLALVLGRLAFGGMAVLGVLLAAVVIFPTFTPGRMLELLGLGGVAIGFAFRDILQNYLAGVLLLLTEPFRIGDQIVYKDFEGTVEEIETRATAIRTYDGRRVVIPNSELFTNAITVNTAFPERRIEYDIGIGYGDDVERARELVLEVLRETEGVLADPAPDVLLFDLAASSVVLRVRWWIEPPRRKDALESRDHVLAAIKRRLTENGIDLPFPTQQILLHDQTEETDGDRARQREGWPAGAAGRDTPSKASLASALRDLGLKISGGARRGAEDAQNARSTRPPRDERRG